MTRSNDNSPAELVVIGSANTDLVAVAGHIPTAGETVIGHGFRTVHGGKGANQAVAAARLGCRTAFVGCIGDDQFGRDLASGLMQANVDIRALRVCSDTPSGIALIVVSESGENAICVAPGANAMLSPADIDRAAPLLAQARVCLLQLEIPLATALYAIKLARQAGLEVILDPAPVPPIVPAELFDVDILTPNQGEAAKLLGREGLKSEPIYLANEGLRRGSRAVVIKLGPAGAFFATPAENRSIPAHPVTVVDSTGAGDAFAAALAVARTQRKPINEAVEFAVAAGSLACTQFGAQPSMPTMAQVQSFIRSP